MNESILVLVEKTLQPERFEHSVNVAAQAVHLAQIYAVDQEKAQLAGILHDICKNMSKKEQLQWIKKSGIILDSSLSKQPPVWHGLAAAGYLQQQLGIQDQDILNAVRYHTIGREGMSRLEQLIYLADLTSKERNYPDVAEMRQIVEISLEKGMRAALIYSMESLISAGKPVCLDTCCAYNQYLDY